MHAFTVRDYQPEDFVEINRLWKLIGMGGLHRGDTSEVILRSIEMGGKLFVLDNASSQGIIGTSWLTLDGRRVYLHHFGINPDFQGLGLSHLLMKASLDFAKEKKMQIKLEVHKKNHAAINLYKKYGFQYLGDYNVYIIRGI